VYQDWKSTFQRVISGAEAVPEADMLAPGRYGWLGEWSLGQILEATYDHHHEEHLGPLQNWLSEHGYEETGA
jgi:hypothetical protein